MREQITRIVTMGAALLLVLGACVEAPITGAEQATVTMRFLTPATVRTLIVEVTGPGIDPPVVVNFAVGADTTATGTLTLPAGSARRFLVRAVDTAGVETHRVDTTLTLQAGANPGIALRLVPLPSTIGITVTFGGARLTVSDTSLRRMRVGDTLRIVATGTTASGGSATAGQLVWGAENPAIATVAGGLISAVRKGSTFVSVAYLGAAARVRVDVDTALTPGFTSIANGHEHTCAIYTDGRAFCWGRNDFGQLGVADADPAARSVPTAVQTSVRFTQLTAGARHTCGVSTGGQAYCWGWNETFQLGNGTGETKWLPTPVSGGLTWSSLSAGREHTCGLTTGGTAYCWGEGRTNAQLGTGFEELRSTPTAVSGGLVFASLQGGANTTCGLLASGEAYCWGRNPSGGAGDGTTQSRLVPVAVATSLRFRAIAPGGDQTCAITLDHTAYCWGTNFRAQLGNGTFSDALSPVPVTFAQPVKSISVSPAHGCLTDAAGRVHCWGRSLFGNIGDGSNADFRTVPSQVSGLSGAIAISANGLTDNDVAYHSCALLPTAVAYCWGSNAFSQLGDGTTVPRYVPVPVVMP